MGEGSGEVVGEDDDEEEGEEEGDREGDVAGGEGRRSGISMSVSVFVLASWGLREGEGMLEDVSAVVDSVVVVVVVVSAAVFFVALVGSTIRNERGSSCRESSLLVVVGLSSVEMDEVPFSAARTRPLK